jgi:hypothetical protein
MEPLVDDLVQVDIREQGLLWTDAKVHPDHHIQVQRALYSVPTRYIGRMVRVRSDRLVVRIYLGGELIKTHARQAPGGRATDPNDYPPGKDAYATRSFTGIIERAREQGPHVGRYAERLFDRPLPWTTMRQGYQLLRLCDTCGASKVDAVCERALIFDVLDVPRIARMLKQAVRAEDDAEQRGKLRRLPQVPRFARDAGTYSPVACSRTSTAADLASLSEQVDYVQERASPAAADCSRAMTRDHAGRARRRSR